jgi:hypothetical protein
LDERVDRVGPTLFLKIDKLCDFISRTNIAFERELAGVALCDACGELARSDWYPELHEKVRKAFRDDLDLEVNGAPALLGRFPLHYTEDDSPISHRILDALEAKFGARGSAPYWLGKALHTDDESMSKRTARLEILSHWGYSGACALKVLSHYKRFPGAMPH